MKKGGGHRLHYRTCCLCEAMCGLEIAHHDGKILSIKPDKEDSFSQGHICPKAVALQDIHSDPDRLHQPLRRTGRSWEEISWESAYKEVAGRLREIQAKHGRNAVASYMGNPNAHHYGTLIFVDLFIKALGSRNRFSVASVDHLPQALACRLLFGNQLLFPVPDIDRTDFFLCIGANPVVSNGSLMGVPGVGKRFKALQKRGGELVVVDPRRTETAELADKHHFIRPGNDVWLLLAMVKWLFDEERVEIDQLAGYIEGIEELRDQLTSFDFTALAERSGLGINLIAELADRLMEARHSVVYGRVGSCTQPHGTLVAWLIYLLNILTGSFDREGGLLFPEPAVDLAGLAKLSGNEGGFDRFRSRVSNYPEFSGEFPVAALAEEILTPGEGQIRGLVSLAGNPVLSTPNGHRLDEALENLEFMVAIDFYLNETTRHADIILPPVSPLERPHYSLGVHAVATRNSAKYSPALFDSKNNSPQDWEILLELATRIGSSPLARFKGRVFRPILRGLGADRFLDLFLKMGPYGSFNPLADGLSLKKLKKKPHGIDLGSLKTSMPGRLFTADRKIRLLHPVYTRGLDNLRLLLAKGEAGTAPFLLIGRRQPRSNNSWMHNYRRLVKGKPRCTLLINDYDAERLSIEEGERVRVISRTGDVTVSVEITGSIMAGVVSLPHGWGHSRKGTKLTVAAEVAGVSMNDLTDEQLVDDLSGTAVLNGIPVVIERIPT